MADAERRRVRRRYANDREINRLVKTAERLGLTPKSITFHPDGGLTLADVSPADDHAQQTEETAYDRWQKRKSITAP